LREGEYQQNFRTCIQEKLVTENEGASDQVALICDRAKHELLALMKSLPLGPAASKSLPEWMTASQLAEYWQILDEKGKPRTAGILKWAKRTPEEFPLPHAYMGDLLRFYREDVDIWAREEGIRRRVQSERKRKRARLITAID
jgi:hypothetical protein